MRSIESAFAAGVTLPFRLEGGATGDAPTNVAGDARAFRRLVESSPDAMVVVDADGRVAYLNRAAERLFRRSREEMRGEPFGFPMSTGRATRIDVLPRNGEPRVAEMHVASTTWQGHPARLATLRDIGTHVAMERSLQLSSVVFSHAAEGIAFLDEELRLVEVNDAFATFFDRSSEQLVERRLPEVVDGVDGNDPLVRRMQDLGPGARWRGELSFTTPGGATRSVLVSVVHVDGETRFDSYYVLLCTDITDLKRAEATLRHEARHDALTGLANRAAFLETLEAALSRARRKRSGLAVLFLDLDGFKDVNDRFGHEQGDVLLVEIARRMRAVVRAGDIVARLGGDEFTVLLEDVADPAAIVAVADKLHEAIERPVELDGEYLRVRGSIGASLFPGNGEHAADLLARADLALYRVKAAGSGGFRFFTPHMDRRVRLRREKGRRLARALQADRLRLVFQPQVDIESGEVSAVEALLRYPGRAVGWRRPDRLIAVAEEARLVSQVLEWVLTNAARAARHWPGQPPVAVNLCPRQLLVDRLDERIAALVEAAGLPPSRLIIHIPVDGLMVHPQRAVELADRLRRKGVSVCVDHFGHGSFSVARLEALRPDAVCVDRRVVADMLDVEERRMTFHAMLAMLESMRLPVVVQGIERAAQLAWLREGASAPAVQGEYLAHPLEGGEVTAWLERACNRDAT